MKTKVCSKCGKELPITSFSKQKDMKDGYRNDCKECVAKRSQKWREENYLRKLQDYIQRFEYLGIRGEGCI